MGASISNLALVIHECSKKNVNTQRKSLKKIINMGPQQPNDYHYNNTLKDM